MIPFVYDDGGRAAAGFKGDAGDCVTRAIAIVTGRNYRQVYDDLFELGRRRYAGQLTGADITRRASPRNGVDPAVYRRYLDTLGLHWTPTMFIGQGTKVHLRADELPDGRLVVRCSKHVTAVIDGVLHDTYDCSREGTRAVYGHWWYPL